MSTPAAERNAPAAQPPRTENAELSRYVSDLTARFGIYALPACEARRIVDESMGASSLTALLYKSREDNAK